MTGVLILVVGPSGVGKDTLLDGARDALESDPRFYFLRRDITRPASAGGEAHNSVTIAEFQSRLESGAYRLHWGAHDLLYGLPVSELSGLDQNQAVIANGSRSVLDEARARFERLAIVSIIARDDLLRQRLMVRNRETEGDIECRISRAAAFKVEGRDVFELMNDGSVEEGVRTFVELLGDLFDFRPQAS